MLIHCTKKLVDEMDIELPIEEEESPVFSWHANFVTLNRRKVLILLQDRSRYVIVLYGLKKKDFNNLDSISQEAIRNIFKQEGVDEAVTASYLEKAGEIRFAKASDKSSITRMVQAAELLRIFQEDLCEDMMLQIGLSLRISRYIIRLGKKSLSYVSPHEELYKDLEQLSGKPALKCRALVLKVTLDLEKFDVWRRIVVPINSTYTALHRALQAAFGWRGYHLHEFYLFGDKDHLSEKNMNHPGYHKAGFKPVLNLVSNEDALSFSDNIEMRAEEGIRLSDVPFQRAKYNYDFGDNWQHYIEVEEVIDDFNGNQPVFLDGSGDAPPEDVGGEQGYVEFLRIMEDETDPEHKDMRKWAEGSSYRKYDPIEVKKSFLIAFRSFRG